LRECDPDNDGQKSIANVCKCEKQYAVKENMVDRSRVETGRLTALATLQGVAFAALLRLHIVWAMKLLLQGGRIVQ